MIGADTTFFLDYENHESTRHQNARAIYAREFGAAAGTLVITPAVLSEFLHAITDARRFPQPLSMPVALQRAERWWTADETIRLHPNDAATALFLRWMREHRLGRKRILDTQLAATLHTAGVQRLITSNPDDFRIFGVFDLIVP